MNRLALIILNYNSIEDTITCVNQLLSFEADFHIIVVDNDSPNGDAAELKSRYRSVRQVDVLLSDRNRGYSAGNNIGIHYAIKTYAVDTVGILNPDVQLPDRRFLEVLLDRLYADPDYAVIGATVLDGEGNYNPNRSGWALPTQKEAVRNHYYKNKRLEVRDPFAAIAPNLVQTDCVAGCFFLAKAEHLASVGFLDEHVFLYNEENILGIKCKEKGYKLVIATDQFYYHMHKAGSAASLRKQLAIQKEGYISRKYLCKTYYSLKFIPLLWCLEMLNRVHIVCEYANGKLYRLAKNIQNRFNGRKYKGKDAG